MMSSFLKDFKAFALRGNVVDMAVGVIIGGAFGKIVASFVSDIIMPPIGMILGGVDFSNLFINLSSKKVDTLAEATAAKVPVIAYGKFITTVIDFLIMAFVIFLMISLLNRFKKEEKECLSIRPQQNVRIVLLISPRTVTEIAFADPCSHSFAKEGACMDPYFLS